MRHTAFHPIRHFSIISLSILMLSLFVDLSQGYSRTESTTVGNLSGTITFSNELPQVRKFNLATYPDPYYCGRISDGNGWRIGPKVTVSTDSRFAGAIIFMKDIKTNKPPKQRTNTIKSLDCRFTPFIGLLEKGEDLTFENWDPVLHSIEVFQSTAKGGRLLFRENLASHRHSRKSDFLQSEKSGIHQSGPPLTYEIRDEGILFFRCPLHEYMEAWAMVLSHDYYAISDEDGHFSISGIPTGTHTLIVWHPIGQIEQTVNIKDQETLELDLDFQPTRSTFYREPEVKMNPFGIELLGDSHIIPSVEKQTE